MVRQPTGLYKTTDLVERNATPPVSWKSKRYTSISEGFRFCTLESSSEISSSYRLILSLYEAPAYLDLINMIDLVSPDGYTNAPDSEFRHLTDRYAMLKFSFRLYVRIDVAVSEFFNP